MRAAHTLCICWEILADEQMAEGFIGCGLLSTCWSSARKCPFAAARENVNPLLQATLVASVENNPPKQEVFLQTIPKRCFEHESDQPRTSKTNMQLWKLTGVLARSFQNNWAKRSKDLQGIKQSRLHCGVQHVMSWLATPTI